MTAERERSAAIAAGRRYYEAKKHKAALSSFTMVMRSCPCYRGLKRSKCSCKDYVTVALRDASIFEEAMYRCECDAGQTFSKCDRSLHIQALDYRAATFEAMNELDRARRDAEWMLELAPRSPEGYLRLGKIAKLQKQYEFAWKLCKAGLEACKDGPMTQKGEQLIAAEKSLAPRFIKKDPMMHLPAEILQAIFGSLSFTDLLISLCVCKEWRTTLTAPGYKILWRSIVVARGRKKCAPPSSKAFANLLALAHGDARSIVIEDPFSVGMDSKKMWMIMSSSQRLENLEIHHPSRIKEKIRMPSKTQAFPALKRLLLHSTNSSHYLQIPLPYDLVRCAAGSLTSLDLLGDPGNSVQNPERYDLPEMPALKYFRWRATETNSVWGTLDALAACTPHLEQILLERIGFERAMSPSMVERLDDFWPKLKVIILRQIEPMKELSVLCELLSVNHGRTLQHVYISCLGMGLEYDDLMGDERGDSNAVRLVYPIGSAIYPEISAGVGYPCLRSLRLENYSSHPARARRALAESAARGRLHTLNIVFPLVSLDSNQGTICAEYLAQFEFLHRCTSIRHIGFHNFGFSTYYPFDELRTFTNFLETLPSLQSVELRGPAKKQDACLLIKAIAAHTSVQKIYQMALSGSALDELLESLPTGGLEVEWRVFPMHWPIPPEELDLEDISITRA